MKEFYIKRGEQGKVYGPFTSEKLKALASSGKLKEEDYVSLDGDTWSFASNVQGLFQATAAAEEEELYADEEDDYEEEVAEEREPRRSSGERRRRRSRDDEADEDDEPRTSRRKSSGGRSRGRQKESQGSNKKVLIMVAALIIIAVSGVLAFTVLGGGSASGNLKYLPGSDMEVLVSVDLNDLWRHPEIQK